MGNGSTPPSSSLPRRARLLGYAGLLPQAAVVALLASGSTWWRFAALSLGYAYAAIILSFLGGMWWGLAASRPDRCPAWVWPVAVAPSLVALATAIPWAVGAAWPGPSLALLGVSLLLSPLVDRRLVAAGVAPGWWMSLRVPLSIGLGLLTLAVAAMG
ncbi:DUF3429 domain-containing protein [Sphingomonas radiodurans]|uniref:DUF3429 domain-containing protein n=1 Tax=Sphingomonas radiodurans TaxID=2890321 RepID=UPI001E426D34|nr:DUF3429 domain-containing protein [Sphingomonas radiodurans]WBH17412.1 DUF3429 domain-containing protein [Sphingomonas radiodurans]